MNNFVGVLLLQTYLAVLLKALYFYNTNVLDLEICFVYSVFSKFLQFAKPSFQPKSLPFRKGKHVKETTLPTVKKVT